MAFMSAPIILAIRKWWHDLFVGGFWSQENQSCGPNELGASSAIARNASCASGRRWQLAVTNVCGRQVAHATLTMHVFRGMPPVLTSRCEGSQHSLFDGCAGCISLTLARNNKLGDV